MCWRSRSVSGLHFGRFRHGVYRHGGHRRGGLAALALGLFAFASSPVRAEGFSASQKTEIEAIIKDYLQQKPEILREAIGVLEAREEAAETKGRQGIVSDPFAAPV